MSDAHRSFIPLNLITNLNFMNIELLYPLPTNHLFAYDPVLMALHQNGTERHPAVAFSNIQYPKIFISKKLFPEWNTLRTPANGCR